jgi:hypothetical protein
VRKLLIKGVCPHHGSPRGGSAGGVELYTCGCSVYGASLYFDCAMGGGCDPVWLQPDDWYALQVATMAERAPA